MMHQSSSSKSEILLNRSTMIFDLKRIAGFIHSHPIGSLTRGRAWWRVVSWQLGSRLLPFPVELPWIAGSCLVTERGMTGATGNWYCGLHEFWDMGLLLHYFGDEAGREDGFLDVGANAGSYTVLASAVCGRRTIAFEALPATFARLERNVRANEIESLVDARCSAVGAANGTILFTADRNSMNQVAEDGYRGPTKEVPVVPLDEVFPVGTDLPSFWKIDVEGFEREVLAGALRCLADPRVKVVLLEGDDPEISSTMKDCGFVRVAYDPFKRSVSPSSDGSHGDNHVWMREPKLVEDRCQASRPIEVMELSI